MPRGRYQQAVLCRGLLLPIRNRAPVLSQLAGAKLRYAAEGIAPRLPAFKQLFENLKKENVYVRYFAKPERISNYLRITIGTDKEMQKLLSLLKKYC